MVVSTLASGSSGNCTLVSDGATHVLVDAGISTKRIREGLSRLSLMPEQLTAVVITHAHSDHISGLAVLARRVGTPIYASEETARAIRYRMAVDHCLQAFAPGDLLALGALTAETIPTLHDCPGSVGYAFTNSAGRKAAVVTDLGTVTPDVADRVCGAQLLVVETNHDPGRVRGGPYPYYLKQRILGESGHLSNDDGAALAALAVSRGAHTLVLAHLSEENNTPALARTAVEFALSRTGASAHIEVAPRRTVGRAYEV